ncbi:MAG: hypothetical protein O2816_13595 [Planctomycetota bacterium]|nr:hypothetical protein [Planctomycetota bacterium]
MRRLITAIALAAATLVPHPVLANESTISCGKPTRTGEVTVLVQLVDANGKKQVVTWKASVPSVATAEQKAASIRDAAPTSIFVTTTGNGSAVRLTSSAGWTITLAAFTKDTTGEKTVFNVFSQAADTDGVFSLSGTAAGHREDGLPAQVTVEVAGALAIVPLFPGQTAEQVEDEVIAALQSQGIPARLATPEDLLELRYSLVDDGRSIVIEEIDDAGITTDCDDLFLEVDATALVDTEAPTSIGYDYCQANDNSTGTHGKIVGLGSPYVSDQDLTLRAYDLPANQFGYFLASRDDGFVANPGGSAGNLCLGGQIGRFVAQVGNSGPQGMLEIQIDPLIIPVAPPTPILPGETWRFQCWFRDVEVAPTSNFTDGIWIEWQ